MNSGAILDAAVFAASIHRGQYRKGDISAPYLEHCLEVAYLLSNLGRIDDETTLIAALLHDTLEEDASKADDIRSRFGGEILEIVKELMDDPALAEAERRKAQVDHAPHLSQGAKAIKLADKISNIRDVIEHRPEGWSDERLAEYIEWGRDVVEGLRGTNDKLEERFDELVCRTLTRIRPRTIQNRPHKPLSSR